MKGKCAEEHAVQAFFPKTVSAYSWTFLGVGALAVGWSLVPFWMSRPEHQDRFLIPLAALWLGYRTRTRFLETPRRPSWLGFGLLLPAILLFVVGWNLQAQIGTRTVLLWWLTLSLLAAAGGLLILQSGWRHAWLLAFPLLFCLLALPTPARIYVPLQQTLKELATRLGAVSLPLLGIPTVRSGFVLSIPSGDMGVAEACSGIRSVNAMLAVALLLAHLRGLGWWRSFALVLGALPIVIVCNGLRIVFQGVLQEHLGRAATEDSVHETLGWFTILLELGLVVLLSMRFRGQPQVPTIVAPPAPVQSTTAECVVTVTDRQPLVAPPAPVQSARGGWVAAGLLSLAVVTCLWVEMQRRDFAEEVHLQSLALRIGEWQGVEAPIPPVVPEMLTPDQAVHRLYRNAVGQEVHVWVLFWSSAAHTVNTAEIHHPDICWPTRGWTIQQRTGKALLGRGLGVGVPVSVRHYERAGREQIVFYWTQDGVEVGQEEGERRPGDRIGQDWIREVLTGQRRFGAGGRLAILIGAEVWGSAKYTEQALDNFCHAFLPELYTLCPWAQPRQ